MYEELKKLAESATQGPWVAAGPSFGSDSPQYCEEVLVDRAGDEDDTYTVCQAPTGLEKESTADMEFIAAANPSAVLALIGRLEVSESMEGLYTSTVTVERAELKQTKRERDQLKAENEALRKDAERYRFIRDADRSDGILDVDDLGLYAMESLDEVVDEAMLREGEVRQ